jgi:hypothetical protein
MMPGVLEESVEAFVGRFRDAAAEVTLTGHVEGDPLRECLVAGVVLQVFERTGPYLVASGPARVILHPECDAVEVVTLPSAESGREVEVVGVSRLRASGVVVERDDPFLVVDAGVPLVVAVTDGVPEIGVGTHVRFTSRAPVHGFVLPPATAARLRESPDELV